MSCFRPVRLTSVVLCLQGFAALSGVPLKAQTPPQQPAPQQPAQPAPSAPQNPANPFENVPETKAPEQPAAPGPQIANQTGTITGIEFRGNRRVPADTLRALIFTKTGDPYNVDTLHRDFIALWNTNRFDDIRLETEPGEGGGIILRFVMTERPVIRTINYEGAKSVSTSDILDRFKERKVGLSVESQYDPAKVQRAAVVIKELLSEHGHQFATVTPDLRRIPPNSLEVIFKIDEGPKVKVGKIQPEGNDAFSDKDVIRAMTNLHPYGIPHSIVLESLFSKTFDSSKFTEDQERIRQAYTDKGYWFAKVVNGEVVLRDIAGTGRKLPFFMKSKPSKVADLKVVIEEGHQQHLAKIDYVGVKLFRTPEVLSKSLFQMQPGDVFSTAKLRKGIDNMKKLYSQFGYIDFVPEPSIDPGPKGTDTIELTLNVDEGKQFFVRRIDFVGNTTTRDKVIRRELLLDEGDIYSGNLWDASILRLNQLGYFEVLKENESYDIKRNPNENTIDITLKVKEKGKNTIGLNGGVSGIAGTFVGANYSTNNFLGLGETLSLEAQLGTITESVSLGFTQPYVFDTRMQVGILTYIRRYSFDQARQASILANQNLIPFYQELGNSNLLNYVQNSKGASLSVSYPIRRSFARVGITYGFDDSTIIPGTTGATNYFNYLQFSTVSGPSALQGIKTSKITPSYQYNSKNNPLEPTKGKSIYISTEFAASFLGGNVNTIRPTIDIQYYHPAPKFLFNPNHRNTFAFHFLGAFIAGYGGKDPPPFARSFIGGEQDIRGFDFYGITPVGYIPNTATVDVYNNNGSMKTVNNLVGGVLTQTPVTMQIPYYQLITPGGDTTGVFNFEYRIPILGPVTLAPFVDLGVDRISLPNELRVDQSRVDALNGEFPQAGFTNKVLLAPGTQAPRMSTGLELQVLLPVVRAPFRIYYALNPLNVREYLQPPEVADRSIFPNQTTYENAVLNNGYGAALPFFERRGTFKFTIGRTF
jgi:outer membrane protein insertion porin family